MLSGLSHSELDDEPLLPRKSAHSEANFDITAMIDLVFMMNIFFLVTTVGATMAELDLPTARHCSPADRDSSVVVMIKATRDRGPAIVTVDDGGSSEPLIDPVAEERRVRSAIEAGVRARKNTILIKAEKDVRLRDVARIGAIAASVPGTELKVSVIEKD